MEKLKIAFVCVHNSCRSQIAEALGKYYLSKRFDFYSAGTHIKDKINEDAVRLVKEKYDIDMNKTQYSKLISDIPDINILITMGCNVQCPNVKCDHREDWGLDDPSGKEDDEFLRIIDIIDKKVRELDKRF